MSNYIKDILLVGTGNMSMEYIKVLKDMGKACEVVGNSDRSVKDFQEKTGQSAFRGGIEKYLNEKEDCPLPDYAIVAVDGEKLYEVTDMLIEKEITNILVEKPGSITFEQIYSLSEKAERKGANIFIGYNRRFYASVKKAEKIIREDGGILSLNFEFTEWSEVVRHTSNSEEVKKKWFLMNSSHVVDLAFYLMGRPIHMVSNIKGGMTWHPAGSIYYGCGESEQGVPFTYHANWDAPGRWGIEILTRCHRLYLRPLEKLRLQEKESIVIKDCNIDDEMDQKYKAGLYCETEAFLGISAGTERLCRLKDQEQNMILYKKISGEYY